MTKTPSVAYEPRDVNHRALLVVGIGIVISAIVVNFAVRLTFDHFATLDRQKGLEPSARVRSDAVTRPPEPRLQVDPANDLNILRAKESEILHSYAWVDRQAGVVRIPIEQAMKLLAERQR